MIVDLLPGTAIRAGTPGNRGQAINWGQAQSDLTANQTKEFMPVRFVPDCNSDEAVYACPLFPFVIGDGSLEDY